MRILVACEESQRVTIALREREGMRLTLAIFKIVVGVIQNGT